MKNTYIDYCFILSSEKQQPFAYYQLPKSLFTDKRLSSLSLGAKVLYCIMLDRISLSIKSGWIDSQGRVFIYMTIDEVMRLLDCAKQKACKAMAELSNAGLILSKRQGFGKPNVIFVKRFHS